MPARTRGDSYCKCSHRTHSHNGSRVVGAIDGIDERAHALGLAPDVAGRGVARAFELCSDEKAV